jgi:acetyltransferase-like isoleucine patch superfamily enzyme
VLADLRWLLARRRALRALRRDNPGCVFDPRCTATGCRFGRDVAVGPRSHLVDVVMGDFSYVAGRTTIANAEIGRFCSIGEEVAIGLPRHPARDFVSTHPALFSATNRGIARSLVSESAFDEAPAPTRVGNDVWIGNRALIPGGVSLADGAIVAAGAVVTRDVPPYAIVGGNPARLIRYRFTDAEIAFLLGSRWWDLPEDALRRLASAFGDPATFRAALERLGDGGSTKA